MGQKVNPIGLRLGINRNWESRWFPNFKTAPASLGEDHKIRTFLKKELYYAGVSNIIIERTVKRLRVTIVAARPGIIIGKKGADIERVKKALEKLVSKKSGVKKSINVVLKYNENGYSVINELKRVSKPGRRIYKGRDDIKRFKNGYGTLVVSTSQGVIANDEAFKRGIGGEVICSIW